MAGVPTGRDSAEVGRRAAEMLAAYQRIAAKMYTLDSHAGRRFLAGSRLSGETAAIAERLESGALVAWSRFDELRRLCDKVPSAAAFEKLDAPGLDQIGALLEHAGVKLDAEGLPVYSSQRPVAETVTLPQLGQTVEDACARLLELCTTVDSACGAVADAAAAVTADLEAAEAAAAEIGMTGNATLLRLRDRHTSALDDALSDPVTARHRDGLTELSREVAAFTQWLAELAALRRGFAERLARLHEAVAGLAELESVAEAACTAARRTIAAPAVPRLDPEAPGLTERLRELQTLAGQADWHNLAEQIRLVTERLPRAEEAARLVTGNANALVDRRAELRGRFAAYSSKAARTGVIETPQVADGAERTRKLLWQAPCDLPAATRALSRFQQDISAAQEETP